MHFNKFSYSPQAKYNRILRPFRENEYKNYSTAQRGLRIKQHDDWRFEPTESSSHQNVSANKN
jgi:hypothetical protein